MRSRDYTQEIGVSSARQRVPVAVAFVVLAAVIVAALWFVREVRSHQPAHAETAAQPAAVRVSSR